MRVGGA